MALTTTSSKVITTSGGESVFNYAFKILDDDDLTVYKNEVLQTKTTDYTVSGVGDDAGGQVTFVSGTTAGDKVIISRVVDFDQTLDIPSAPAKFPEQSVEDALDLLTMQCQQLNEVDSRSLHVAASFDDSTFSAEIPDPSDNAGAVIGLSATGLTAITVQTTDFANPLTTKGDIVVYGASSHTRKAIGANNALLVPDSGEADGMKWQPGLTTKGAILTSDGTDYDVLTAGNNDEIIVFDSAETEGIKATPQRLWEEPIINGGMQVAQRGTSFAAAANNTITLDCWEYEKVGTMVHTVTQDTDVPTKANQGGWYTATSLKIDCTTADTSIAAADACLIKQHIEGYRARMLFNKAFTVSFWFKATKAGTYCFSVTNSGADRSFVYEYTVTADTWEYHEIPVSAFDIDSGGTWDKTTGIGYRFRWCLAAGTNFHGTNNTWESANDLATSNQVNACDSTSNNVWLTMVQADLGADAKPYRPQPFDTDLRNCMRYFQKSYAYATAPGTITSDGVINYKAHSTNHRGSMKFPVPMRAAPSVAMYNPALSSTTGSMRDTTAGANITTAAAHITADGFAWDCTSTVDLNEMEGHYTADATL